jgi:hypothetical protein
LIQTVGIHISIYSILKYKDILTLTTEMRRDWNVKVFATIIAGAPNTRLPIVDIRFVQSMVTTRANKLLLQLETIFHVNVAAPNMLNQRTLLNVEGLAVWTTVSDRDAAGTTFGATDYFVKNLPF